MDESEDPDREIDDAAVDALIEEFGGDLRAACRALLHDLDVLARDYSVSVSRGFVRADKTIWVQTISIARREG